MLSSRDNILRKISSALSTKVAQPFPEAAASKENIFATAPAQEEYAQYFATAFTALGGKFIYCEHEQELLKQLVQLADTYQWQHVHCIEPFFSNLFTEHDLPFTRTGTMPPHFDAAVTSAAYAVARLGSLIISSADASGRAAPVYCPVHICVVYASQLVWDIDDATNHMLTTYGTEWPSMVSLTTGPSRTADIEKTLVVGVHGPKEVYVLYVDKIAP